LRVAPLKGYYTPDRSMLSAWAVFIYIMIFYIEYILILL